MNPSGGQIRGRLPFAGDFTGDSDRSARHRIRRKLLAVGAAARKRKEEEPRRYPTRIILQSFNLHSREFRHDRLFQPDAREYFFQVHLLNWTRIRSPSWRGEPGAGY